MKVKELIDMLEDFDGEMDVQFAYNYGDHWRTMVSSGIQDVIGGVVEYSDYHRMNKLVEDEDGNPPDSIEDNQKLVVVLR